MTLKALAIVIGAAVLLGRDAPSCAADSVSSRWPTAVAAKQTGRIDVLDAGRRVRSIALPGGLGSAPAVRVAWSPDGAWLAIATRRGVYVWNRTTGRGRSIVTGEPGTIDLNVSWSPRADVLLVTTYASEPARASTATRTFRAGRTLLADPSGSVRTLANFGIDPSGVIWRSGGREPKGYVVSSNPPYTAWEQSRDELDEVSASNLATMAGAEFIATSVVGGQLQFAGMSPDGHDILFWSGSQRSASIAADGQDLNDVRLGASPRRLGFTLEDDGYVALAPGSGRVAFIEGATRLAWHDKQLRICTLASGACATAPVPARTVTLEPTWSPRGNRLAFVRAADLGPSVWGFASSEDYQRQWVATRELWIADATGKPSRRIADGDVWWPRWSPGTQLAFVRDNRLWLAPADGSAPPRAITGSIENVADPFGSYGIRRDRGDPFATR